MLDRDPATQEQGNQMDRFDDDRSGLVIRDFSRIPAEHHRLIVRQKQYFSAYQTFWAAQERESHSYGFEGGRFAAIGVISRVPGFQQQESRPRDSGTEPHWSVLHC